MVDKANKKIASLPDGFTSGELEIMRGDLAGILYETTRHDAEYIFDDSIAHMTEGDHGVEVTFAHGDRRVFDLVVGADGLHSNVRALAFGAESDFIHDLGLYISIFTTPNFMNLDRSGVYYGTLGKKVGIFSARDNSEAKASFFLASPPLRYDRRDVAQQKQILRDRFAQEEWEVPRLLKMMDDAPDFLLRLRQPDQNGPMVIRPIGFAWRRSMVPLPRVRDGYWHGRCRSIHSCR